MWTYSQSTGRFTDSHGKLIAKGYSGNGDGKNNPLFQGAKAIGPIPQGKWKMVRLYDSERVGKVTIELVPDPSTKTFGRGDFRIHGDSIKAPGTASHGCIILNRIVRQMVWDSGDRDLLVVA